MRKFIPPTCSVLAIALVSVPAVAQDKGAKDEATAASEDSEQRVGNFEEIVVQARSEIGGGMMKSQTAPEAISSITGEGVMLNAPAASPLQVATRMPGVNFSVSSSFGLSVRNFISVRGLDQTEIGWLLEGVPAIDSSNFFPFTETYADNENISDITLTAGNSRLQDPIVNATGGEFIVSVRQPSDDLGVTLSVAGGSYASKRAFGRFDTGLIPGTRLKAFGSVSFTRGDDFAGPGVNRRLHADFKAQNEWSDTATSSLFLSYTDFDNARFLPLSTANFKIAKAADDFDRFADRADWPVGGATNFIDRTYVFKNNLYVVLNNKFALSDRVNLTVTPYYKHIWTQPNGIVSVDPASLYSGNQRVTPVFNASQLQNGRLFLNSQQLARQDYYGVNSNVEISLNDSNHLMFGYWYDRWDDRADVPLSVIDGTGFAGYGSRFTLRDTTGAEIKGTDYKVGTNTHQLFIGDTQGFLNDRLKVTVGLKYLHYVAFGDNYAPGTQQSFKYTVNKFMPRIAVSFDADKDVQLYGNVTTNARMPLVVNTYVDVYNVATGARTVVGNPDAKAEYSVGEQAGIRYKGWLSVDFNLFATQLRNRQIQSLQFINGVSTAQVISAGSEDIKGAALEIGSRRYGGFSVYGNAQYLDAKFKDNISTGNDFLPTAGKQMVLSPKWMLGAGLNYDRNGLFGVLSYRYVGPQYSTFVNDERMPGYHVLDLAFGYRLPEMGALKEPKIQVNLNNLVTGIYRGIAASVTTNAAPVRGVGGTLINGSAPTYYLGAPFSALVSFSTSF